MVNAPPGARVWCTLVTVSGECTVFVAPPSTFEALGHPGLSGLTRADDGFILIDDTLPLSRAVITLVHELLHQLLSTPGEVDLLAHLFRCKPSEADAREELLVAHLAPKFADALTRNGLLFLPPIPPKDAS